MKQYRKCLVCGKKIVIDNQLIMGAVACSTTGNYGSAVFDESWPNFGGKYKYVHFYICDPCFKRGMDKKIIREGYAIDYESAYKALLAKIGLSFNPDNNEKIRAYTQIGITKWITTTPKMARMDK